MLGFPSKMLSAIGLSRLLVLKYPVGGRFEELESVSLPGRARRFLAHGLGAASVALLPSHGQENLHWRSLDQLRRARGEESPRAHVFRGRGRFEPFSCRVRAAELKQNAHLHALVLPALSLLGL